MKRNKELTPARLDALVRFAEVRPKTWKNDLIDYWQGSATSIWVKEEDAPLLRQIRNLLFPQIREVTLPQLKLWHREDYWRRQAIAEYHDGINVSVEGVDGELPEVSPNEEDGCAWVQAWVRVEAHDA